jgi:hypothetical protein
MDNIAVFIFFGLPVALLIGYYIYSNYRMVKGLFCLNCGYNGKIKQRPRGSGLIELILWLCFLIPGLIYTAWRGHKKEYICPKCQSDHIVSKKNIKAREYVEMSRNIKCPFCAEFIKPEAVICKHCGKTIGQM